LIRVKDEKNEEIKKTFQKSLKQNFFPVKVVKNIEAGSGNRIRIRIGEKCWIRISIETYADPKHWVLLRLQNLHGETVPSTCTILAEQN
jgi:hypothetical protein